MRRSLGGLLAGLAVVAAAPSGPEARADPSEVDYSTRLAMVSDLARRYPGRREPGPLGELGLWAGIFVQTRWQRDSGRGPIRLWEAVNASLTVEPYIYASEYEAARAAPRQHCRSSPFVSAHPTPPGAPGPPIDRVDVCEAWVRYLQAHDRGDPVIGSGWPTRWGASGIVQAMLWDAHTTAMVHAVRERRPELEQAGRELPAEFRFWASWLETVLELEAINLPTSGAVALPAGRIFPACAPVRTDRCGPAEVGGPAQRSFVAALTARPASIDTVFARYVLGHPPEA